MDKLQIVVKEWMSSLLRSVDHGTTVGDAYNLMMRHGIRRLPVVKGGELVGIVTLSDLREARPTAVTSLSIYELNYLLGKLTVGQVMTHHPYTVTTATPIQEAARIMLTRKVGGLPVVDEHDKPVGIITESDIVRMLIGKWDYFTGQHVDPGLVTTLIAQEISR